MDKSGIKTRDEVLKIGISKYNEECRKIVMRYSSEWKQTIDRLGRWVDFENGYKTLDKSFMESVWWVFKQLYEKDLVYHGVKVMPYSNACNTPLSNFEAKSNYKKVSDPSITVIFKLENNKSRFLGKILEEDFHLSFPFIFKFNDTFYMCPETREKKDIRLYIFG